MTFSEMASIASGVGALIGGIAALLRVIHRARRPRRPNGSTSSSMKSSQVGRRARFIPWIALSAGLITLGVVMITVIAPSVGCRLHLRSPDGRYQAVPVEAGADVHYEVREIATRRVVFKTRGMCQRL